MFTQSSGKQINSKLGKEFFFLYRKLTSYKYEELKKIELLLDINDQVEYNIYNYYLDKYRKYAMYIVELLEDYINARYDYSNLLKTILNDALINEEKEIMLFEIKETNIEHPEPTEIDGVKDILDEIIVQTIEVKPIVDVIELLDNIEDYIDEDPITTCEMCGKKVPKTMLCIYCGKPLLLKKSD